VAGYTTWWVPIVVRHVYFTYFPHCYVLVSTAIQQCEGTMLLCGLWGVGGIFKFSTAHLHGWSDVTVIFWWRYDIHFCAATRRAVWSGKSVKILFPWFVQRQPCIGSCSEKHNNVQAWSPTYKESDIKLAELSPRNHVARWVHGCKESPSPNKDDLWGCGILTNSMKN